MVVAKDEHRLVDQVQLHLGGNLHWVLRLESGISPATGSFLGNVVVSPSGAVEVGIPDVTHRYAFRLIRIRYGTLT